MENTNDNNTVSVQVNISEDMNFAIVNHQLKFRKRHGSRITKRKIIEEILKVGFEKWNQENESN